MKEFSIQTRVFILALLPTLIISILLGSYIIISRFQDVEKNFRLRNEMVLTHLINTTRHIMSKKNLQTLRDYLTRFLLTDQDELRYIAVFDSNHNMIALSGDDDAAIRELSQKLPFNAKTFSEFTTKESVTIIAPIIVKHFDNHYQEIIQDSSKQQIYGWIAINRSRSILTLSEYEILTTTVLVLMLGIFISTFLAQHTAKKLTRPILTMLKAVKRLGKGELETRVNGEACGEIKELQEGINNMASSLQNGRDELQHNIQQATADLTYSLETIEIQNIALAKAQKEALDASRIKSEFIANMSHEIRTPMNSIIGFTNLLMETNVTSLQKTYLTTIQKSTLNLLNLVNNILDFSRLDAGHVRLESLVFDIRECIDEIVTTMSPLAHAKQLKFVSIIDKTVPQKILGDPLRIKQIITNLVSNAIKFTEKGEVIIHLDVETESYETVELHFAISDTGIGFPVENLKNVFDAFQQADASHSRKYGGTGLGLVICKKLIDQMNGAIGCENNPKGGSTIWFSLSVKKASANTKTQQLLKPTKNQVLFTDKKILCVDDNIQNGNLILALLNQTDMAIKLANSGFEAIEFTNNEKFNVILMDLRMPQMDGYETLKCIRQSNNPNQSTPAIAISAHITDEERNQLSTTGFIAILQKPISKIELITAINKALLNEPNTQAEMPKPIELKQQTNDNIIDWDISLMLANGNRELAQEMLQLLLKSLTVEFVEIKEAYDSHDFTLFLQRLHKLHGAVSYCGVPRLKRAIAILETALKKNQHSEIEKLFRTFETAANELLEQSKT